MTFLRLFPSSLIILFLVWSVESALAQDQPVEDHMKCRNVHDIVNDAANPASGEFGRTICADIVAMDQMLVYNRFGSFNPFGMIFAMRRDVVPTDLAPKRLDADACDDLLGIESYGEGLVAGEVRLRDCKRPRPLTLRANPGDILHVRMTNLLRAPDPGFSQDYCGAEASATGGPRGGLFHLVRGWLSEGTDSQVAHGEAACRTDPSSPGPAADDMNWPATRGASLAIQGLGVFGLDGDTIIEAHDACRGLGAIAPGEDVNCYYKAEREGPFFMASTGAPSGGEGDGGSLTHGLFGAVVVEPGGSRWYRSQISRAAFDKAWPKLNDGEDKDHARERDKITDISQYNISVRDRHASGEVLPLLDMLAKAGGAGVFRLLHADLNAIVHRKGEDDKALNFREFSVFFHDELKTFYTRNFEELGDFGEGQLAGVGDGFAINYGASGMGDMLLANRKGIGPAANCKECLYEEFFLTSWANGDPALLEQFSDDPSNVHHSYLNDPVVFRNFHAGPKETHVFHLHAHQWFAGNDSGRGAYLDSQTVAPQQGFSYDIYGGGMEVYHKGDGDAEGWFETLGSGNRNRTVGDSIFHCHLYPHFAQGMWELWRVHDVIEDGTRKLPDGQWEPDLSLAEMMPETRDKMRPGSVHQATGRWIEPGDGLDGRNVGTPIPAIVPLPGQPWPLIPSYPEGKAKLTDSGKVAYEPVDEIDTFAGYPFYIAAQPGHRPPQAPKDIARELSGDRVTKAYLDGGLPRHVMTDNSSRSVPFKLPQDVTDRLAQPSQAADLAAALISAPLKDREALQSQVFAAALALGDLTLKLKTAELDLLEYDGEPIERTAMAFHHDGRVIGSGAPLRLRAADGAASGFDPASGGYKTLSGSGLFPVNAAPPKPGAPFADPCGTPTAPEAVTRRDANTYEIEIGGGTFDVFAAPAGGSLTGMSPATDAEVTNWVEYQRSDHHPDGAPQLFYVDAGGTRVKIDRGNHVLEADPFVLGLRNTPFAPDPAVAGYRRYEGSAVQVDLVTNRAGWHDPQARINVLSADSDTYKAGDGRISPKVTASEEPFFFRALSGECIEFRHTNELPKDLELDDFQVKTPTDTIGQHIHLVKFDVTSSDGSANGFNYEDGTLAPGEIAARICAAKNTGTAAEIKPATGPGARQPGELAIREFKGLCAQDADGTWQVSDTFDHKIWRKKLTDYRELFQTTTQRWFADPILSDTRAADDEGGVGKADRTLRTVFSHDHFAPSSIQQHGFYSALLIEPQSALFCDDAARTCTTLRGDRELRVADADDVGPRKAIVDLLPLDGDAHTYREFALSIADFALLYDPRDKNTETDLETRISSPAADAMAMKGMVTLFCEARHAIAEDPAKMADICGSDLSDGPDGWNSGGSGNVAPGWLAAARPGDQPAHKQGMEPDLFSGLRVEYEGSDYAADAFLETYLVEYRRKAAGFEPQDADAPMANPVAPPQRPESISVDHHDPYLVNYRGEPFPLRIGEDSSATSDCALKPTADWADEWVTELETGVVAECEISRQKPDDPGDMANVMLSKLHDDPATPILRSEDEDPLQFRLIQGAQEVQHTFTIEGTNLPRNVDQVFPTGRRVLDDITSRAALVRACETASGSQSGVQIARAGRPDQYDRWTSHGWGGFSGAGDKAYWKDFEDQLANCFNTEGRVTAQPVGISEHFEFESAFLYDTNIIALLADLDQAEKRDRVTLEGLGREVDALRTRINKGLDVSDTPYHFGSQDALWNGAWGLIRVSKPERERYLHAALLERLDSFSEQLGAPGQEGPPSREQLREITPYLDAPLDRITRDFPAVTDSFPNQFRRQELRLPNGEPLGDVVPALPDRPLPLDLLRDRALGTIREMPQAQRDGVLRRFQPPDPLRPDQPPSIEKFLRRFRDDPEAPDPEPLAQCPDNALRVQTAIVAIEARVAFEGRPAAKSGTPYAEWIHDTDGLFFALVDPRRLIDPDAPEDVAETEVEDPENWTAIPLSRIQKVIQDTYARPEPLVVNVNAGDCVVVTLLNALTQTDGARPHGLPDRPGDAPMPPITSLNVERPWDYVFHEGQTPIEAHADGDRSKDAVPSSRLAVTLPLPVLTRQSTYARPFGKSGVWALAGISAAEPDPRLAMIPDEIDSPGNPRKAQIEQFEFYAGLAFGDRKRGPVPYMVSSAAPLLKDPLFDATQRVLPAGIAALPLFGETTIGRRLANIADIRAETREPVQEILQEYAQISPVFRDPDVLDFPRNIDRLPDFRNAPDFTRPRFDPDLRDFEPQRPDRRLTAEIPREFDATLTRLRDADLVVGNPGNDGAGRILPLDKAIREAIATGALAIDDARIVTDRLSGITKELRAELDAFRRDVISPQKLRNHLETEFFPYAFGALPLKSFGDLIGHPSHGLIGAVTVAPLNATIGDVRAPKRRFAACENGLMLPERFWGLREHRGERDLAQRLREAGPLLRRNDLGARLGKFWFDDPRIRPLCASYVIVPEPINPAKPARPMWEAHLKAGGPDGGTAHAIRQFTLFWQDGLNLQDRRTADRFEEAGHDDRLVENCLVCDDSYDLGERGVSYRAEPFHVRLRGETGNPTTIESHYDTNEFQFDLNFFRLEPGEVPPVDTSLPVLRAAEGEEVVIHVVHPGGRARQRAFATIAQDYNDLFPGFGFARAALLAPGKAITASLTKPVEAGCYLWTDGPLQTRAGGTWGLLDVVRSSDLGDSEITSCGPLQ